MELYEGILGIREQGPKGDIRLTNEKATFIGNSGLALNYRELEGGWRVTHVGTGNCIGAASKPDDRFQSYEEALEKGQKLAAIIDWTKPTFEELKSQLTEWRTVNKITSFRSWLEESE